MKKLENKDLELLLSSLNKIEQRGLSSSDNGTYDHPYSLDDLNNWQGTWYGGYVQGLGYVNAEAITYGYSVRCYSYRETFINYGLYENVGARATFTSSAYTLICNGRLTIGGSVALLSTKIN